MSKISLLISAAAALSLGACAVVPPAGPSIAAMPQSGKPLAQFQQDDYVCRQYAGQSIGYASPQAAANQSAVGSAVVGTGLGAAAGALIGAAAGNPGVGAAIGAGSGLLIGSAAGASNAEASSAGLQQRYDISYAQCMTSRGDKVPDPQQFAGGYGGYAAAYGYPAPYYPYPYPAYAYGYPYPYYPYYGSSVSFGFGFGGGFRGHRWHR